MTHPKLHRLFAIAFLLLASNDLFSQQLLLKGRVIDRHTEEPLPFVNVYLQGTTIGTTTNLEGFYSLISKKISDTLVASAIGYDKGKKNVTEKAEQILNFKLDRSNINLSEVVILAGENPAHEILRNIIDNKAGNNKESLDFYQFEVYNKLELDIDDISDEFMQKKYFRPFSFIFENIDSMSEEKPFLPVFLTESLSDFYFRANPHSQKEIIKASKISGVKNESVTQFLGSMYQDINIYDNWIPVLGKTFISPISASGFYYYKYYLIDSAFIDNYWCYQINFKPKHKGDNTFIGDFWVNDTTYAIKKISMQVDENVNLNFVERLSVFQEFIPVDSIWMLKKDKLIIDFITTDKTPGLIGRKATSYDKFNINDSTTNNIFRETQDIIVSEDVFDKDESFWQQARHEELTDNEEKIYALVDTLKSIPLFKTYINVVTILVSGYYIVGKVEIGPY
ncbi:MAG: carboxypeptidase-like regulatory domain-containing protein, partial [Bacteroidetes bacterium]|nr:carboxypeptidase-like regulatory domain-containing protein [Bacteroidota bacterium]